MNPGTPHLVIGTAGHIDHGKSALVRALTGTDPDRLKEEKARGITIDLGFAHWEREGTTFAFVDVPGHERFVKNMLAGVGGIDAVMLVVAADESVMPQTREHFDICRLLHVPAGLVVLTKADLADADMRELARLEVRELVAGSFLEDAPILPVSSKTGEGLTALRDALGALAARAARRPADGPPRLPIDRVFSIRGFGTVVTGTLVSGAIRADDELLILPQGRPVKVRGLQVHGARQDEARGGQRLAVNLGGVEVTDVQRGDTLSVPRAFECTRVVDAALDVLPASRPLRHGARVRFHHGTSEVLGRVATAGVVGRAGSADAPVAAEIGPGQRAYVRLRLEAPAVLTRGDRFILRASSPPATIAGGVVMDAAPARTPIRTAAGRSRFERLDPDAGGAPGSSREDRAILQMIAESGAAGIPLSALTSRAGIAPGGVAAVLARLSGAGHAVVAGGVLVGGPVVADLERRLRQLLQDYHGAQPLFEGMPREEVRERLFAHAAPELFEHVVGGLVGSGAVGGRDRLSLATHRVALSSGEQQARDRIERLFQAAGLKPPEPSGVAAAAGIAPDLAERMVALLQRQKVLVKVDTLLFHQDALRQLKEEVVGLKAGPGARAELDVARFKERYGITRKYAIPLLEYLDRERVTRRVGDTRLVI